MKKMILRIVCVLLSVMLPASALAEPLPWLMPWLSRSYVDQDTPYPTVSLSFDIDAEELMALYQRYNDIQNEMWLALFNSYFDEEAEDNESAEPDESEYTYAYIQAETPWIVSQLKACAALLNALKLQLTQGEAGILYDLLLQDESIITLGLWQLPDKGMVMTSNLFPTVAVPYAANQDINPGLQAVTDAVSGHTEEIAAGIPALLEYNILDAGLRGTKQDLALLLNPKDADAPLVYDGDIKDFIAQYDALGLPYAPGYSLLQAVYNHTVDQEFSAFIHDILDATEAGRYHLHVEADVNEALWALTEETEYEKVTWRETETGSMLVNYETCQATNTFSLRFLPTQLQFSLRELWTAHGTFLNLSVLVDAEAKDEITASIQMSYETDDEEPLMQRDYALRLTRSEEGQRLSIQTAFQAGYHTDDFDYEASIPIEIVAEIPNDGSRIPVTLYFEDEAGVSHAVGAMILDVIYMEEALPTPDFDAMTMLNGLQDTRLMDDFRANGVSWLNLAIMTKLPADAHPLMFELLALVVQLARAN